MHISVLTNEVIDYLNPKPNRNFIDTTYGLGGHSAAILEHNIPNGRVLGIEIDKELYRMALAAKIKDQRSKIKNRLVLVNDSFTHIKRIVSRKDFESVHGILFDLGFSSWHIEESRRGFSFQKDELLDMRFNPGIQELTAAHIINQWREEDLVRIFREYGEERYAKRIARAIRKERKKKRIISTKQLSDIITEVYPGFLRGMRLNPATKVFQALRIAVNNELENIQTALPQAFEILVREGRLVVISFHSLEDRIVKQYFRELKQESRAVVLTKKPVRASDPEIKQNPRSRSARLRAIKKL